MKPKVFLSWSGDSKGVAEALHDFLAGALQSVEPWLSHYDIGKGMRSFPEIEKALEQCDAGIICLTRNSLSSLWVAFESGYLASKVTRGRVAPFLVGIKPTDIAGPLSTFQATVPEKDDVLKLLLALNDLNPEPDRVKAQWVEKSLEKWWEPFQLHLEGIQSTLDRDPEAPGDALRSGPEILEDIYLTTQAIQRALALAPWHERSRDLQPRLEDISEPEPSLDQPAEQHSILSNEVKAAPHAPFLKDRASLPDLAPRIEAAGNIWLLGASLAAITAAYFGELMERVRSGQCNVRFLLLDPSDEGLLEIASRSLYSVSSGEQLREDIEQVVQRVDQLKSSASHRDQVQIGYLNSIPSSAIVAVDPRRETGFMMIEHYTYKVSSSYRPHFILQYEDTTHRPWFAFYREQYLSAWKVSGRVEIEGP